MSGSPRHINTRWLVECRALSGVMHWVKIEWGIFFMDLTAVHCHTRPAHTDFDFFFQVSHRFSLIVLRNSLTRM